MLESSEANVDEAHLEELQDQNRTKQPNKKSIA